MKHNPVLIFITAILLTACASHQVTMPELVKKPSSKTVAIKSDAQKELAPGISVGKPVAGSKFAQLKIGMPLEQVERLIGLPNKQWRHPTSKNAIPYYFGPDRWVIQYSYKGEGMLTLNSGGEQVLTHIEVNKNE